ncbi:TonB-dependent receptor [Spirosoma montaniterrae]|uniref:TonB-dependent receptor n=1 Tax=Spirosoma montaniterrae TaxID=1178516 RepID=A0A1P9X3X5_9BACT|nr:carboxypeptidase regulatory-like domain-containing protein [Spirosoma montaniterrae]AQG82321.1 TonB-dependent receptor [Spirosoma montaniterrae]
MKRLLLLVCLGVGYIHTYAQVTTASIYGFIRDDKGATLPGATVVATHQPTGAQYGVTTRAEGEFNLANMRVGGPYTITVSFVGYQTETVENVYLSLGQKLPLNLSIRSDARQLSEIEVRANPNDVLNNNRTGAQTNISNEQIKTLPTIKRSIFDYTRLTPMSGGDGSFGGRNSRFNNFSLNGTIFNNPFGLDAATPGGQADAQPVSLDAIDQIQVALSPFDVTQAGFTGAGINAVAKSGTNQFHGTAFGFFRNQELTGKKVKGTDITVPQSSQAQYGFSVGGPIIKNKLFFFANAEFDNRSDLGTAGWVAARPGLTGANVSRVTAADLELVSSTLRSVHGYETGAYENFTHKTQNAKGLLRLDWNVNRVHKLSVIYNFLDASRDLPANPSAIGRRGPDFLTLQYFSSGYRINNKLHSVITELNSNFNGKYANKLQIGFTNFNDSRDPFSTPFPTINIGKDGVRYIVAGHEPFSINNRLDQSVFQITNNFNVYLKKHTLTLGGTFERFNFDNSFNLGAYAGVFGPEYASVADFVTAARGADFAKSVADAKARFAGGQWALAQTSVGQLGLYAQDEFVVNPRFTLTYGLKVDFPMYFDTQQKIQENIDRNEGVYQPDNQYYDENGNPVKLNSLTLPTTAPLFSPRFGFNYDLKGDGTRKLRGGSGIFTGRFPFVWIGNQVANPAFFFYCVTDPNFKFPQVWKTSLGYDHKFKSGWITSVDVLYNKDINAMLVRNYGLRLPGGTLQDPSNRPIYRTADRAVNAFGGQTDAYVFTNTNLGYSFNASIQAQRTWANGLYVSAAYNFLNAKDASSLSAEISSDAYARNPAYGNVNQAVLGPSFYGNRHRFVGSASKRFVYGFSRNWATTLSAVAEYAEGNRFSFTYAGDINNDGAFDNDLLFIPTAAQLSQMRFSGTTEQQNTQRAAFESYIQQDKYLSANRGQVAGKFASTTPWFSTLDVRAVQEYVLPNKHAIQLSVDILNFGNLLNSNWGVRQTASYTGLAQPLGVSVTNGVPTYSFDANQRSTFFNDTQLISRWRMQVGARYTF